MPPAAIVARRNEADKRGDRHRRRALGPAEGPGQAGKRRIISRGDEALRRQAVVFVYKVKLGLGPDDGDLDDGPDGTVRYICDLMSISNAAAVADALKRHRADPSLGVGDRRAAPPRKPKVCRAEAAMYHEKLKVPGTGGRAATLQLKIARTKAGLPSVSRKTYRLTAAKALDMKLRPRRKRKAGSNKVGSAWCKARLAMAQQFHTQLTGSGQVLRQSKLPRLALDQILHLDELHRKVLGSLGCPDSGANDEYVVPLDGDGNPCPIAEGGEYPEGAPKPTKKASQEVRALFGIMMKKSGVNAAGKQTYTGHRMDPFFYNKCTVVGPGQIELLVEQEVANATKRAKAWGPTSWPAKYNKPGMGGRYGAKYKDDPRGWKCHAIAAIRSGNNIKGCARMHATMSVVELFDHARAEGDRLFAGTAYEDTYVLAHDALSTWHSAEAKAYMKSKGFGPNRLLTCRQEFLEVFSKKDADTSVDDFGRYKGRLTGNGPEMSPLDNSCFSDLQRGITLHVALSASMDGIEGGHKDKFRNDSIPHLQRTIERVWTCNPSDDRIVQDISRWAETLKRIIEAKGVAVEDNNRRHGHRAIEGLQRVTEPETYSDLHVHPTLQPHLDTSTSADAERLRTIYGLEGVAD